MKHLLLQFAETPNQENIDTSMIVYDKVQNLNVLRGTNIPAVVFNDQATETFTKADFEGTDSDRNFAKDIDIILGTSTQTRKFNEVSDDDKRSNLNMLLDTSTQTFNNEGSSDSDEDIHNIKYFMDTRTLTESNEVTDND